MWRFYAFTFFRNLAFFSAVLIPFFTQWGNVSLTQALLLQSWFMLCVFLLEVPTGAVADYFGRKYSLALSGFFAVLGVLIYGSIPRFEIFLLGEAILALSYALMSGADSAILYDTLKAAGKEHQSKKLFGYVHAAQMLGIMVSGPLGSIIASLFGLNAPMLFTAVPFLIAALIALSMKEPNRFEHISESRRYLHIMKQGFLYLYTHKKLRVIALDAVIVTCAAFFSIWLYQPLLIKMSVPIVYFGYIHAAIAVCQIGVASNFTRFEGLFGSEQAFMRFTAVITGIAFLIVALIPSIVTLLIFVMLAGGFGLTRLEYMSAFMHRFIPSPQRATVISSVSMLRRILMVFLYPMVGFLADRSLTVALIAVSLLPFAVFFFSPLEQGTLEE